MTYLSITPDQLASAGSYIGREWGDYGYRIEGIETRTYMVSVFRVAASDGSRFSVLTDKWGNCRHLNTHNSDDGLAELVTEMHAIAVNPSGTAPAEISEPCPAQEYDDETYALNHPENAI